MTSRARRVLPIPGGPKAVTSRGARSASAASNADRTRASSSRRPTSGASSLRSKAGAPSTTRTSRCAGTGSGFPFAATGSTGSTSTASRASWSVGSPRRISPGSAACSSRAATLTASPVTRASPAPATTWPVLTPIRASKPSAVTASRSSTAARSARSASSSWSTGMPNTAITASPMNFSTVPPWRSRAIRASSKYRAWRLRSASGSSWSPVLV